MSVQEKIGELYNSNPQYYYFVKAGLFDEMEKALFNADIETCYHLQLRFIKWYNKEQAS